VLGVEHPHTLDTINRLAGLYYAQGRFAEARSLAQEKLEIVRRAPGNDHPRMLSSIGNLALVHLALNELDQALPLLQELHALQRAKLGPADRQTLETTDQLATSLLRQKKIAEAEPLLREYVDVCTRNHPDDWIGFKLRSLLGGVLLHQAQEFQATDQAAVEKLHSEAELLLLAGYEGMKSRENKLPKAEKPNLSVTLKSLVRLYTAWDKPAEAARWQNELNARAATVPERPASPPTPDP